MAFLVTDAAGRRDKGPNGGADISWKRRTVMRPVIGVTSMEMAVPDFSPVYKTNQNYIHAIREAGGIPVMLPAIGAEYAAEYAAGIDGLLLPGRGGRQSAPL